MAQSRVLAIMQTLAHPRGAEQEAATEHPRDAETAAGILSGYALFILIYYASSATSARSQQGLRLAWDAFRVLSHSPPYLQATRQVVPAPLDAEEPCTACRHRS